MHCCYNYCYSEEEEGEGEGEGGIFNESKKEIVENGEQINNKDDDLEWMKPLHLSVEYLRPFGVILRYNNPNKRNKLSTSADNNNSNSINKNESNSKQMDIRDIPPQELRKLCWYVLLPISLYIYRMKECYNSNLIHSPYI